MKADNAHKASILVTHAEALERAANVLLQDDSDLVKVKIEADWFGRLLAEARIPPTYIAKAIKDYREAVVIQAEALGVEF